MLGWKTTLSTGGRVPAIRISAFLAAVCVSLVCGSSAVARAVSKVVSYHGYQVTVPASWPVFDLNRDPTVCVRFNRHAVYLGDPGARQRCPANAVGRSEALLLQPILAGAAFARGTHGPALPAVANRRALASEGTSTAFTLPGRGLTVTATWDHHPQLILRALGARSVTALRRRPGTPTRASAAKARPRAGAAAAVYTGLGFDVCSTPSTSTMAAWGSSPYRAIGIYIGGANMACSQSNQSAAWASQETAAGWDLILIYVGLQAPSNSCGCASISPSSAYSEGTAAANDAIAHAQALGVAPGGAIYDDMEAYPHTGSNTSAVLSFLSGWTTALHAAGYLSGVYSSTGSGIADLVSNWGTGYAEPDELWIADWNGEQTTSDPSVPSGDWGSHQRIHQYGGGTDETWGGVTLNIDHDYVDAATAAASCTDQFPDGTFIQVSGTYAVYRIAGGAPLLVSNWSTVGGQQPVTTIFWQQFYALCPVPANGTFLMSSSGEAYRVVGGAPVPVTNWALFGGVQPYVTIDQWDIQNVGNPAAHLYPAPTDGTVVEGLPSRTYWTFSGGKRRLGGRHSQAVAVDDAGLAAFPAIPCVVPRLRHLSLPRARQALAKTDCVLGKVHRPRHWPRHHQLRVVWQIPRAHSQHSAGWRVGIRLK